MNEIIVTALKGGGAILALASTVVGYLWWALTAMRITEGEWVDLTTREKILWIFLACIIIPVISYAAGDILK